MNTRYKLVLDRMVGIYRLHKNVAVVCAGNLETDNAIVQPMSTALQSRLVHMELRVDTEEWGTWAAEKGIHPTITSYIKFKPGQLYTFKPDHTDVTYACPRTWDFANDIIKVVGLDDPDLLPLLSGTLSEGVAREFLGFIRIYESLPKIQDIMLSPETEKIPDEPSVLYAITGSLAHNATSKNKEGLMKYICRLPVEFQVVCLRETLQRDKTLLTNKGIQTWLTENSAELF